MTKRTIVPVNTSTGGHWSAQETDQHINFVELKACYLRFLKSFCRNISGVHIQMYLDNSVAVSYIQKKGGRIAT